MYFCNFRQLQMINLDFYVSQSLVDTNGIISLNETSSWQHCGRLNCINEGAAEQYFAGEKNPVYWRFITVQFSVPGQSPNGKALAGINTFGMGRGCLASAHFVCQHFWFSGCKLCRSADLALAVPLLKYSWVAACLLRGTCLPRGGRSSSSPCHVIYSSCHLSKATKFSFYLQKWLFFLLTPPGIWNIKI